MRKFIVTMLFAVTVALASSASTISKTYYPRNSDDCNILILREDGSFSITGKEISMRGTYDIKENKWGSDYWITFYVPNDWGSYDEYRGRLVNAVDNNCSVLHFDNVVWTARNSEN